MGHVKLSYKIEYSIGRNTFVARILSHEGVFCIILEYFVDFGTNIKNFAGGCHGFRYEYGGFYGECHNEKYAIEVILSWYNQHE